MIRFTPILAENFIGFFTCMGTGLLGCLLAILLVGAVITAKTKMSVSRRLLSVGMKLGVLQVVAYIGILLSSTSIDWMNPGDWLPHFTASLLPFACIAIWRATLEPERKEEANQSVHTNAGKKPPTSAESGPRRG